MRATPDGPRSVEVSDTETLSYGEVMALATGDPDFLEAAKLDDQVARLERLSRAHGRDTVAARAVSPPAKGKPRHSTARSLIWLRSLSASLGLIPTAGGR